MKFGVIAAFIFGLIGAAQASEQDPALMVYQQLLARANEEIALSARKLAAFQAKVQELEAKVPKPAELNQNKE